MKQKIINSDSRALPSAPYAKSMTVHGTTAKKGSSEMKNSFPSDECLVKDGAKNKK